MTAILPSVTLRPRLLFDVTFARLLDALDWSLDAETGQPATFLRTTAATAIDSSGATINVPPRAPRFSWGTLDFDDDVATVGLVVSGDVLTYPFTPSSPLTLYVRFARGASGAAGAILEIGGLTGPRLVLEEDPAQGYTATYDNGVTSISSSVDAVLIVGDAVELRIVLDGTITLGYALAGADEELGPTSAAIAMAAAWDDPTLSVGASLGGAAPTNHTFVRLAAALSEEPMSTFRPAGRGGYAGPLSVDMVLQEISPGVFDFVASPASADLELVETSPGVYEAVAVGTSPGADRIIGRRIGGHHVVVS